ncbi:MAG: hydrogenase formation protein HypD [Kiritimatiellae bacterium]|nr:hydrogenase formation protein HypD [Kiritimatiellia bacterium]MDD5523169.1 hydrogenase formation protein HypD [Kiritimatiellia bacterium]
MKYIDGFRNPAAASRLRERITDLAGTLKRSGRTATIMEVCGTHTMAIARFGIRDILPDNVDLISGPGCPVCVTEPGYIDAAITLAKKDAMIVTFGDMINVPGSDMTLAQCRAQGASIEVAYSPSSAVALAQQHPDREVVFLAIGFETTIAPVTTLVGTAAGKGIRNLSLLTAFKLVPPALKVLMADPTLEIDAFLCPAHVSAIIGSDAYIPYTGPKGVPCVIAGFEPLDILLGIEGILKQLINEKAEVENQYNRVVRPEGNIKAKKLMEKYLQPVDARWRGLGLVTNSGLEIRREYETFDARKKHNIKIRKGKEPAGCLCGDVIKGKLKPTACPLFAAGCTPDHAVGPCMISSEGSCAAYYKYSR